MTTINITLLGADGAQVSAPGQPAAAGNKPAANDSGAKPVASLPTSIKAQGVDVPVSPKGTITKDGKTLVLKLAAFTTEGAIVGVVDKGELKPIKLAPVAAK